MNKFFDFDSIQVRGSRSGVKKTICPVCSADRKKKNDPCLYVNFDSGVAKCFNCTSLSFAESNALKTNKKEYSIILQEWKNYTELSDDLVKWVWSDRKISQNTLNQLEISEEKHYQPSKQKELNNIVFNYFEGEQLVNKKFRSGGKDFTQIKGGKPILYNINSVIGQEEIYICEGEFDVLALYEIGIKNAVSIPNGANDNDEYWINSEPYLKDVKNFIICTDTDEKGIEIREKIAQRLGRYRCTFIEFDNKDANGDLINGNLEKTIKNRQRFSIGGTFTSFDLLDDILKLHSDGLPKTICPRKDVFGDLYKDFSIMMGQLTVVTGIPSHGKSTFVDWFTLNLVHEFDLKASFYSPEHSPLELYNANFIQKAIGKPFFGKDEKRINQTDILRYVEWSREKLYFTTANEGSNADWDWLFEKFKEQMFTYGINIFIIDAWNKVNMPKGLGGKEGIDNILTRLTLFCQQNNVHIFLIAHPTKMKRNEKTKLYEIPTLYDVSGSSDFRNQTHNGFTIYRMFEDENSQGFTQFINQKTKYSFQGNIGASVKFNYDIDSARYYVDGTFPNTFDLTEKYIEVEDIDIFDSIKPNEQFDNVPF